MINSYYNRQPISHEQFIELCKKNFKAALEYNKLWRGTLVPITPIHKNLFPRTPIDDVRWITFVLFWILRCEFALEIFWHTL